MTDPAPPERSDAWDWELLVGPLGGTTEGPVWDGHSLYFTHVPTSRILRYDPGTGSVETAYEATERTNGLAMDASGQLFGCSGDGHAIRRFDDSGGSDVLPNQLDGRTINRPNDLAIDRRGRIWFSDPRGKADPSEIELGHTSVLRLDPTPDGGYELRRMTHDTIEPNGVLLSADETELYVAHGGHTAPVRELRAYPIHDGEVDGYRVLVCFGRDSMSEAEVEDARTRWPHILDRAGVEGLGAHRGVDGMVLDDAGNIIACAGSTDWGPGPMLWIVTPTGRVLETQPCPVDKPTNCTFGDADLGSLYVTTAQGHLFRVRNTGRRGTGPSRGRP